MKLEQAEKLERGVHLFLGWLYVAVFLVCGVSFIVLSISVWNLGHMKLMLLFSTGFGICIVLMGIQMFGRVYEETFKRGN